MADRAGFTSGVFTVTLANAPDVGAVVAAAKGPDVEYGTLQGPACGAYQGLPPRPITIPISIPVATYRIAFLSVLSHADGSSTWRYRVEELAGAADLSGWVLGLSGCQVLSAAPAVGVTIGADAATGLAGVRWATAPSFSSGEFAVTIANATRVGLTDVAVESSSVAYGRSVGPVCGAPDDDDEERPAEPPAVIVIERPSAPVIVVENGVSFVTWVIRISNSGGRARGVFLVLDLRLLDLSDLRFLSGAGYVREVRGNQVIIGIGQNNVLRGTVELDLRFTVKDEDDDDDDANERRARIRYTLEYDDSDGRGRVEPVAVEVLVPAIVATTPVLAAVPRLTVDVIDGRFRSRWGRDGLRRYGLPLTQAITLRSGVIVQYFERARFEYHPQHEGTPYVILLGLLGVELGYGQPPAAAPADPAELAWYFTPTGHLIAPRLRDYWRDQGGLLAFGYPIGAATVDRNGAVVQYFERARLEYHPEFAGSENEVLLGLLGEELLIRTGGEVALDD